MCDECFNQAELFFQSRNEYVDFDLILSKKLMYENGLIFEQFIKTSENQVDSRDFEEVGYYLYKCANCGQFWALEEFKRFYKIDIEIVKEQMIKNDTNRSKNMVFWRLFGTFLIILLTILYCCIK